MTIDGSLNEVEMIAMRAARGGGCAWGIAEETGRAARWLASSGFDWAALLRKGLDASGRTRPAHEVGMTTLEPDSSAADISPLNAGCWLLDRAQTGRSIRIANVAAPILLAPFAARAAKLGGKSAALHADDVCLAFTASGDLSNPDAFEKLERVQKATLTFQWTDEIAVASCAKATRSAAAAGDLAALQALAARTYVPASEASRNAGAGGGSTDID